jgi:hypothetical protein
MGLMCILDTDSVYNFFSGVSYNGNLCLLKNLINIPIILVYGLVAVNIREIYKTFKCVDLTFSITAAQ